MKSLLRSRALAGLAASVLVLPILAGCGSGGRDTSGANLPPLDASNGSRPMGYGGQTQPPQQQRRGMSTGQKVALLAGAAALYYMYQKNRKERAQGNNSQPQYYLSKNGRVYYRDQSGRAVWVTPPQGGIQVPYEEAMAYRDFQGYDNRPDGRTLLDVYRQNPNAGQGGY